MKPVLNLIFFLVILKPAFSQLGAGSKITAQYQSPSFVDTTFWRTEKKAKSSFWGNSTYVSSAINFSRNTEIDFSIGRTNGIVTDAGRGIGECTLSSWGLGYGLTNSKGEAKHNLKAFYEYVHFPFILIGNFVVRGEYIYNLTVKQSYLRPSIGLTIIYVDLAYNYSFLLNENENVNIFKHGISLRIKYFLGKRNWQKNKFVRQTGL